MHADPSVGSVESVVVTDDGTMLWVEASSSTQPTPTVRPLLLLATPGGRNSAYWPSSLVAELVAGGLDVVRFDWRGQGRSGWPPGPLDAEVLVDDLDAVASAVLGQGEAGPAGRPLYVAGVALGGWVAAVLARRLATRGRRPARLVLLGTSGWYGDPAMPGPTEPTVVALVLRRRGGGPAELARALSREVAVEEARPGPLDGARRLAEARRWIEHGFNTEDTHRVCWLGAPSLWDELDGLADEVVVLHGAADPVVPLAHGERLAAAAAAELQVLVGVGHHLDEIAAARLAEVLLRPLA